MAAVAEEHVMCCDVIAKLSIKPDDSDFTGHSRPSSSSSMEEYHPILFFHALNWRCCHLDTHHLQNPPLTTMVARLVPLDLNQALTLNDGNPSSLKYQRYHGIIFL